MLINIIKEDSNFNNNPCFVAGWKISCIGVFHTEFSHVFQVVWSVGRFEMVFRWFGEQVGLRCFQVVWRAGRFEMVLDGLERRQVLGVFRWFGEQVGLKWFLSWKLEIKRWFGVQIDWKQVFLMGFRVGIVIIMVCIILIITIIFRMNNVVNIMYM